MGETESLALKQAMEAVMPAGERGRKERVLDALRTASGPELAAAAGSSLVSWTELLEAGLPREDRFAELAMLYREDCPVEFLRMSRFKLEALKDPALPLTTARAVLEATPTALDISVLSQRKDLQHKELHTAAVRGRAVERWRGRSGGEYAALPCLRAGWLDLASNTVDDEIVGILRNPHCPEEVVRRYLTCGAARIRLQALTVTYRRNLAIESSLVIAARDLPMTDSTKFPRRDRVVAIANRILAAR